MQFADHSRSCRQILILNGEISH